MTVMLHAKEIRVSVEEGSIHHLIIKNFVARYFSSVVRRDDAMIIMHRDSEVAQKRYFFQWLYSAYGKQRQNLPPAFIKMLQSAVTFPIFVRILGLARPVTSISVRLWLPSGVNGNFAIAIEPASSLAVNFFHHSFLRHITRRIAANEFEIAANEASLATLSELFTRKQILAQPVSFSYDKASIDRLFSRQSAKTERNERKERFFSLVIEEETKLKNAYQLLGVPMNANEETIKQSYRKLALRYHPDRTYANGEAAIAENTKRFYMINDAYEQICTHLSSV
ncbi:hypothetical protein AGMMS50229_12030 [Campylobacterota bacterium]|nr:hypothetical protein AGMMS50229_12030 [Campylobacterota bacterium]